MRKTHMTVHRILLTLAIAGTLGAPGAFAEQPGKAKGYAKAKAAKAARDERNADRDAQTARSSTDQPMRFREMDQNGDRVITRAEWRGNDQSFKEQDTNADGVLSGNEVALSVQRPAPDRSRREERAVRFDRMDRDHDGRIGRNEWEAAAAAFARADLDHDGVISRAEYLDVAGNPPAGVRRDTTAYRAGYDRGLIEGRDAGQGDRVVNGGKWDLEGQRELEQADSGYRADLGTRTDYQAGYRAGFRVGYAEGFGPRR
jgi:EF hand domain-containing protein